MTETDDSVAPAPAGPPDRPVFRITYEVTELRECTVRAESESAARQAFIGGDRDFDKLIEHVETSIIAITKENHE